MLSLATAAALRAAGLPWSPAPGDRFVIAQRDMDDEVFVLSDMTIEAHDYPTGRVLGFNGTTEWALDSVAVEQALWLPREDQLRSALGVAFVGLRRGGPGWSVGTAEDGAPPSWTTARDVEEAYALAVLARDPEDPVRLLPVAAEGFAWRVHAVGAGAWHDATPLDDWDVRDVVSHLVAEQLWVPHLLGGQTLEQVGGRYDGDLLGDDPAAAWDAASQVALRAWAQLADRRLRVHTSMGPIGVLDYAEQMLLDLTVHAWDLSRGAGLDDSLDATCVRHVLGYSRPRVDQWQDVGVFKAPVTTAAHDPADQLLALLGRDPTSSST